jgi:exopolyphosphatase/guanosine-5'-triphosphate,3'-diphosphate pyrophosphatase
VILSSIDMGTNTVLLLIAEVSEDGTISPLLHEQRLPRLGKGVDSSRTLTAHSMDRAIEVLREYRDRVEEHGAASTIVCGTSAVRDAANREEFALRVFRETGFTLEVLTGEMEARWGYRGAVSGVPGLKAALVVDIGGGSTEFAAGNERLPHASRSVDTGSVRLSERFFMHDPPAPEEVEQARASVRREIPGIEVPPGATFVGVAGTVTALAVLAQGLKEFQISTVTNYPLTRLAVDQLFGRLSGLPSRAIRELSSAMEGRADVITAGALILQEVMRHFACDEILVSERGLRYGLLIREWERLHPKG